MLDLRRGVAGGVPTGGECGTDVSEIAGSARRGTAGLCGTAGHDGLLVRPGPRRIRWPLGGDVLVDVEEVARIVGTLDLDQAVVVLAVVVLDFVVIVVLHEVDIAAGL